MGGSAVAPIRAESLAGALLYGDILPLTAGTMMWRDTNGTTPVPDWIPIRFHDAFLIQSNWAKAQRCSWPDAIYGFIPYKKFKKGNVEYKLKPVTWKKTGATKKAIITPES